MKTAFDHLLQLVVILLMTALAAVVLLGIGFRTAGAALVWYDEVASILLAWVTFYGSALAALRRGHIGVPGVVATFPPGLRALAWLIAEGLVFAFFILVAWVGWQVVQVLEGSYLASLPSVSVPFVQSVIPIGAALFVIAEALSLPQSWRDTMGAAAAGGVASDAATE